MNGNIDLIKILKDCPEGWEFYHAVFGRVWFNCIDIGFFNYPIRLSLSKEISDNTGVTSKGIFHKDYDGECLLFPSKEQRDWSKFTAPWYKNDKFDPKTLQAFSMVLVRDDESCKWRADFYSHKSDSMAYPYRCIGKAYTYCIPYNDDTKHLVGTRDEAPEYYKYWED